MEYKIKATTKVQSFNLIEYFYFNTCDRWRMVIYIILMVVECMKCVLYHNLNLIVEAIIIIEIASKDIEQRPSYHTTQNFSTPEVFPQ